MTTNSKLFTGLIGLIIIWLLMLVFKWQCIEKDIGSRTSQTLNAAGYGWANVDTDHRGRNVLLSGLVRNEDDKDAAEAAAKAVYGVHRVDAGAVTYRPLKGASLSVKSESGRLLLSGSMRSEAMSRQLAAQIDAAVPTPVDSIIRNNQDFEKPQWLTEVPSLVADLSFIEELAMDIEQQAVNVGGVVRNEAERQRAADRISRLAGISSADITDLKIVPYASSEFSMSSVAGGIALKGALNSEVEAAHLRGLLAQGLGEDIASDQLSVDSGTAPGHWLGDLAMVSPDLGSVEGASAEFAGGVLKLSGIVRTRDEYDQIAAHAASMLVMDNLDLSDLELRPYSPPWFEIQTSGTTAKLRAMVRDETEVGGITDALAAGGGAVTDIAGEMDVSADVAIAEWGDDVTSLVQIFSAVEQGRMLLRDGGLTLSGVVRDQSRYDALVQQAGNSGVAGAVDVSGLSLRPFKSPRFSAISTQDAVLVSGLLGRQSEADKLTEAARIVFGAEASVQLLLDPDVTEAGWVNDVMRMMPSMTGLESSSLSVTDNVIDMSGLARSKDAYELVSAAIDGAQSESINNKVSLRPWQQPTLDVFSNGQRLEAVGMMPDQNALDRLQQQLSALGTRTGVSPEIVLAVGPDVQNSPWLSALTDLVPELALLQQPRLRAAEGIITISGITDSALDAGVLGERVEKAAMGLQVNNLIEIRQPPPTPEPVPEPMSAPQPVAEQEINRCEESLDGVMADKNIEFAFASAELSVTSYGVLNALLEAIRSCPEVLIEVSGHTDNVGSDSANIVLSEQRATSVVNYLVNAGVAASKLVARGYGSDMPIGDNSTEAGRMINRRIEFNIKTTR